MQRGVLHAAVVPVHGRPVVERFLGSELLAVLRVCIAQEIPARTRPVGHGVRFSRCGAAAFGAGGVEPVLCAGKAAAAVVRGRKVVQHRQLERELAVGNRHPAAVLAVDERDGFAPVTLAREHPVAEFVVDLALADFLFFEPVDDGGNRFRNFHAIKEAGVDHFSVLAFGVSFLFDIAACYDFDDRQAERLCKRVVALVVTGNGHDRARAVAHEHIVRNPDRNLFAVDRVNRGDALQRFARFILCQFAALKIALGGGGFLVGAHGGEIRNPVRVFLHERMLGGDDHVGGSKQRIGAGGVNRQRVACSVEREIDQRAFAAADPVDLLGFDLFEIVHRVQIVDEALGVRGDFEHPLGAYHADDLPAAALADAVHDLLVGKADLAGGAEVDRDFRLVGKPLFKELQKDPLRPLIVVRVGRVDFPRIIKGIAEPLQLVAEADDVVVCDFGGVNAGFNGVVLRWQAERVVPDGVEHIEAFQTALARNDVHGGERPRVTDVQPLTGRIGEFDHGKVFRPWIAGFRLIAAGVRPVFLPFQFNGLRVVTFEHPCIPPKVSKYVEYPLWRFLSIERLLYGLRIACYNLFVELYGS
ncbi:hypothetical protein SDC9_53543 [bioreactor metagenome]|uniref:Uncharacterized protein n=1 Tax=bioreactor metagenome TaxID=1076179 RepID=A0A644WU69_9ZZZZ